MPPLTLPWFLHLGGPRPIRFAKQVNVNASNTTTETDQFKLIEPWLYGTADLVAATTGSSDEPKTQAVHTLTLADRAYWLFAEALGSNPKFKEKVVLIPHGGENAPIGGYSDGSVELGYASGETACLYHDMVVHEIGHALLDATHNWNAGSGHQETRAVAESICDTLAMLSAGRMKEARHSAMVETKGDFLSSNVLSRFTAIKDFPGVRRDGAELHRYNQSEDDVGPHALSQVLSSMIYRAFVNYLKTIWVSGNEDRALSDSILEISRAVFAALRASPTEQVRRDTFVRAMHKESSDAMRQAISEAADACEFSLSNETESSVINGLLTADVDFSRADNAEIQNVLSKLIDDEIKVTRRVHQPERIRKRFPLPERTFVHFRRQGGQTGDRGVCGCLTLEVSGRPHLLTLAWLIGN